MKTSMTTDITRRMTALTWLLVALAFFSIQTANAQSEHRPGGATRIEIPVSAVPDTPATLGQFIQGRTAVERQQSMFQQQAAMMKLPYRVTDCNERAQWAGMLVQLRDQDVTEEKIRELMNGVFVETSKTLQADNQIPAWYKLEFIRAINDMARMKPETSLEFARWWGTQCVIHGPWWNPAAQ